MLFRSTHLKEHSLRRRIVGEMHLRRWPELVAPCEIVQILRLIPAELRALETDALDTCLGDLKVDRPEAQRHRSGQLPTGISYIWERHTEASTITLFGARECEASVVNGPVLAGLEEATQLVEQLPGEVLRATRIFIFENEAAAQQKADALGMEASDLVSCHSQDGARLWSDFRIGPDGYGRLVVAANGMNAADLSRLIHRMQELGNYRNLALLGLPVAQDSWPLLDQLEKKISALASDVAGKLAADEELLARVSTLLLELMGISTSTGFRMSATAAYAQLVEERLCEISPQRIPAYNSLTDFTERRLLPAVRTCAVHCARTAELSLRAERFTALLRTQIETRIEGQNAQLLQSMERSSDLQLRLQQLVEGLSVVALSYYSLGLLSYVLKGAHRWIDERVEPTILAATTPIIILATVIAMKWLKTRFLRNS